MGLAFDFFSLEQMCMSLANGMNRGGPAPAPGMAHFALEQLDFSKAALGTTNLISLAVMSH